MGNLRGLKNNKGKRLKLTKRRELQPIILLSHNITTKLNRMNHFTDHNRC